MNPELPPSLRSPQARRRAYPGLELLATAVLLLDAALRIVYANPAAENLFELSKRQLVGQAPRALFGDAAGARRRRSTRRCASGASYTEQELELARQRQAEAAPHLHGVAGRRRRGATLLLEFRHIDQQLKIAREERLLEQQQANRELIRSLAHEIKNPLGGIRGAAQLLERELDRPQLIEYTQVIIGEADRLQSLVNRLLTPHRLPTYRRTNIHEILVRVQAASCRPSSRRSTIVCRLRHQPAGVRRRSRAADAGDAQHRAQRGAGAGRRRPRARRSALTTRVARYVTLAQASAIGWRSRSRSTTTAPAFRRRSATGSSIRWCRGARAAADSVSRIAQTFVAQHNGTIECESVPGRTVFTILLPLEPAAAERAMPG